MDRQNQPSYPGKLTKSSAREIIQKTSFLTGGQQKYLPRNFNFAWKDGADYGPFVKALINADNVYDAPVTSADKDESFYNRAGRIANTTGLATLPNPTGSSVGVAHVPESYWDYIKEKENQNLYNNFMSFIVANMDMATPVKRKYWGEKYPELMEQRDKNLLFQQFIQTKAYLIKRNGIQNEEDAFILYMQEHNFDLNSTWVPAGVGADFERFYGTFISGPSTYEDRSDATDRNLKTVDFKPIYQGTPQVINGNPSMGNGIEVHQNDATKKWIPDDHSKAKFTADRNVVKPEERR